ncbi:MAG: lysine--tRNA ligase [Ruthenibacterium sp.]
MPEHPNMPEETGEMTQQAYNEIVKVRRDKLKALRDAGKDPFVITRYPQTDYSAAAKAGFTDVPEGQLGKAVCMAGRMMSKRVMGKASFAHLRDNEGDIQIYVRRDDVGEEAYADFKKLDIGDIIGVKGNLFRTKMGEISVHATEVTLLSKSLLPLPEKFHGLRDTELRFRQRYVDLIMNPEVRRTFEVRSKFIKFMRSYLDGMGYMEVETPVLNTISGGATARPFITHHNTLNMDMYMRIATELPLKRLIVGGLDRVYEIGRIFRNEGMDPKHNPEFTTVELYQAYADFHDMMDIAEGIISGAAREILGTYDVEWMGYKVNLAPGWKRMTMVQAVKEYVGIDFDAVSDDAAAVAAAKAAGVELAGTADKTWGNALYACFDQKVEENLIQPTFITMYPVEVSPLSKRSPADARLTERFELFICHSELANAFSELNDPIDQRGRFQKQVELRAKGDDEAGMMDEDYLTAMEYGLPPTGGMGIGVDRTVMMLTNSDTIREVILFPTMKPVKDGGAGNDAGGKNASASESSGEAEPEKPAFSNVKIEPIFEEMVDFDTFAKSDFRAVKILACEAVPKSKKLLKFTLDDGERKDRVILSGIHEYYEPEELVGKTAIAIVNLPPRKMMGIYSEGMLISAVHEEDGHEGLNLLMVDSRIPAGAKLY